MSTRRSAGRYAPAAQFAPADRRVCGSILAAFLMSLTVSACGAPSEDEVTDRAYAAESLVVGDWLAETGLLALSRSGDQPELRAAADPSLIVWKRNERLPAVAAVNGIGARSLVFSTPGGDVYRWDLDDERASALDDVEPGAGLSALDGSAAFWAEDRIIVSDATGVRTYTAPGQVAWAAPVPDGGVVALSGGESGSILVALGESSEIMSEMALAVRTPGRLTAGGRYVLFPTVEGREVVIVRIPELEEVGRHEFRRPISALAISASSHEFYVAHSGGRIEAVNRISGTRRELARLPGDVGELRPGIYGQQLLAAGSEGVYRVSLSGAPPARLPVDWRVDLPLGLPSGDVLGARGDSLYLVRDRDGTNGEVDLEFADATARAWWLPVRWTPSSARLASEPGQEEDGDRGSDSPADAAVPDTETAVEDAASAGLADASADTMGTEELEAATAGEALSDSIGLAFTAPAAGYYAVAVASRTAGGVIELVGTLARSGYPTAVQRRRDDGGQMWYRALVGPYPVRERAEASARQLRRERDLDAWVIEVTAGTEGELQPDSR